MQTIPLNTVPSQTLNITLAGQAVKINVYTLATGLYMDVLLAGTLICSGVICLNYNKIIRAPYTGFIGDFMFYDTQGLNDPTYDGLGSRYQLIYLEASDL